MAIVMKYVSKRGREIYFDNWEDEREDPDLGGFWVDLCPKHHNMYKGILKGRIDDCGSGEACCSVLGCDREDAGYYVDFGADELVPVKMKGGKKILKGGNEMNIHPLLPRHTDEQGRLIVKLEGYDKSKQARLTYKCAFEDATDRDFERLRKMEIESGYLYDMSPNV